MAMIADGQGPESLYTQTNTPTFLLTSERSGWREAFFAEVQGSPHNVTDHGHTRFCLQLYHQPGQQRPLKKNAAWTTRGVGCRVNLPGDEQRCETRSRTRNQFLFIEIQRVETIIDRPLRSGCLDRFRGAITPSPMVNSIMAALSHDIEQRHPAGNMVGDSLIVALLTWLDGVETTAPTDVRASGPLAHRDLVRLIEYVDGALDGSLSLDDMAGLVGLSLRHFRRALNAATGQSPHQFVLSRRIERARGMIATNRFCLADVAAAAGFADQSHMTRVFRQATGVTPSAYRIQQVGQPCLVGATKG
jgi:AraC-like DNA-binding protein